MRRWLSPTVLLTILILGTSVVFLCGQRSQTPDQKAPAFEVASIKPNTSGVEQMMIRTPPSGIITATNVTTRLLIRYAYDLPEFLIMGAPNWSVTDHFDVVAKAPANAALSELRGMFRALLADRFAVASHREMQEMPADIVTVENPGRLGPSLTVSNQRCDQPARCGVRWAFGHIDAKDATIGDLVSNLTVLSKRVVIDRTGLGGRYDFSLTYTPDTITLQPSLRSEFPKIDPDGPSLATALKEQLGLKMLSKSERVEVLVIDHVERPTPD
jgi:uncharacterized protein (TIGR03435 family)